MRTTVRPLSIMALLSLTLLAVAGCGSSGGGGTDTYTVTVNISPLGGGTGTGGGDYDDGETATLTASPSTGYHFSYWSGGSGGTSATNTFTVTGDTTVTANFALNWYTLSIDVSPALSGTVSGEGSYSYGSTATLHATPAAGYTFSEWLGATGADATSNPLQVVMGGNRAYTAVFSPNSYNLNLATNIPGAGSVSGGGNYAYGDTVIITASPYPGFLLSQFDVGATATTENPYTHLMTGDVTVTARFRAEAAPWTWVSGPNTENLKGVYGTEEVPASGNYPGARQFAAGWTDASDNIWVHGGYGYTYTDGGTFYNDMWRYDTGSGEWTWMAGPQAVGSYINPSPVYGTKGAPAESTFPGSRRFPVSITAGSYLWLFGGYGLASDGNGDLNDLWRFHTDLGQWEWVSGSSQNNQPGFYGTMGSPAASNVPGSRAQAAGWSDPSGDLWVFGGYGWDDSGSGYKWMNDLWRFDSGSGLWCWEAGSSSGYQFGTYGTKGVGEAGNAPGSRYDSCGTATPDGLLWVFGGYGYDGSNGGGYLNDLWKYNPITGIWTWMAGPKVADVYGVFGSKGVPDAANFPGPRGKATLWSDSYGALWLFGGEGYDWDTGYGSLVDLWRFDPNTGRWAWMAGSEYAGTSPSWGTKGVASLSNTPGGRYNLTVDFFPGTTSLWLFGGTMGNWYSDLWLYSPAGN